MSVSKFFPAHKYLLSCVLSNSIYVKKTIKNISVKQRLKLFKSFSSNNNSVIRQFICVELGEITTSLSYKLLKNFIHKDNSEIVRVQAMESIVEYNKKEILNIFLEKMRSENLLEKYFSIVFYFKLSFISKLEKVEYMIYKYGNTYPELVLLSIYNFLDYKTASDIVRKYIELYIFKDEKKIKILSLRCLNVFYAEDALKKLSFFLKIEDVEIKKVVSEELLKLLSEKPDLITIFSDKIFFIDSLSKQNISDFLDITTVSKIFSLFSKRMIDKIPFFLLEKKALMYDVIQKEVVLGAVRNKELFKVLEFLQKNLMGYSFKESFIFYLLSILRRNNDFELNKTIIIYLKGLRLSQKFYIPLIEIAMIADKHKIELFEISRGIDNG